MKYYKVLKGNVGGFGNKTHSKGSIVSDIMFPNGNAKTLCEMGFLEETKAPKKVEAETVEVVKPGVTEKETVEVKTIEDYTKSEIMDELKKQQIDFNPLDKKSVLFDLLK